MLHVGPLSDADNLKSFNDRRFDGDEMLMARTVKFAMDGTPGKFAWMFEPYADGTSGVPKYHPERLNKVFDQLDEAGLRIYVHAEGDKGIAWVIDAFEYANETGKPLRKDARHVITHLDHLRQQDIPRMKSLNLIAQVQPNWMGFDGYTKTVTAKQIGPERLADMHQFTRLRDAGLMIAAGADWPTGPVISPWEMIQIGATGQELDQADPPRPKPFKVEDLIKQFTINGAFLMFRERLTGSIEVGKRADLIVVNQNILKIPASEIAKTRVLLTVFNGAAVYGATNFKNTPPLSKPVSFHSQDCVFCGAFPPAGLWRVNNE